MKIYLTLIFLALYSVGITQITKISSFINDAPFDRLNSNKAAAVGSKYYFIANEGSYGNELWVTDGSPTGAYMVKDITPGPASTVLSNFVSHKGLLYFFANGGISGEELWRSDGTASGTFIVKDVNSVNSSLLELISDNQFLYFFPFNNQNGNEIWKSDGTAEGTQLLKDIAPGTRSSDGHSMFLFKNKLYFFAKSNNFDAVELWTSDGTTSGTIKIKQLNDLGTTIKNTSVSTNDSLIYFTMQVGTSDQLWTSDGTNLNTKVLKDFGQSVAEMVVLSNHNAIFTLKTGPNLDDIWVSNGTPSGTKVLVDLDNIIKRTPFSVIKFKDAAYILGNDKDNCLLIKTDGIIQNTQIISKFISTTGAQNEKLISFEDEFFIIAFKEDISKIEIFTANEYENSLRPIVLNNEFNGRSPIPSDFRELSNNRIIFKADDRIAGRELYLYKTTKPLRASISINKKISCFGDNKGELEAFATGGNPPYVYNWSNGSQVKSIQNLSAGNYTLSLTDSVGITFTVGTTLNQPSALILDIQQKPETLYQKDGIIEAIVSGGILPYQYKWNSNETINKLTNKSSGSYSVTVTDNNNCTISGSQFLSRIGEFPLNATINVLNKIKCSGESNGALEVITIGGVPPYTYLWSIGVQGKIRQNLLAGNYDVTIIDSVGSTFIATIQLTEPNPLTLDLITSPETLNQKNGTIEAIVSGGDLPYRYYWDTNESNNKLINKSSGNYAVTITDNNDCTISRSQFINRTGEFPLSGQISVSKSINCFGGNDGELRVETQGGLPPYSYSWSNGSQTKLIQNLSADNYSVTITDSLGNNFVATTIFGQPSPLKIDIISTPEILYQKNGTIEAMITGGTVPYNYLWNTTETSNKLIDKSSGTYTVSVTDNNNCMLIKNHIINRIGLFPLSGQIKVNKEILCFDDKNGELEASISGGIPPYNYLWSNGNNTNVLDNISSGNFMVSVTDSLGNSLILDTQLKQPTLLQVDFKSTPEINNLKNGTLATIVSGGTPPYRFYWNTNDTTMNLKNLAGGNYSITVSDHNNCTSTREIMVEQLSNAEDFTTCNFLIKNIITNNLNISTCNELSHNYSICDLSGKVLISGSFTGEENINVSHLQKGMYLVYILNQKNSIVFTRRILTF